MEVGISWPLSKTPDTDKLRYWEVAGTTHFDRFMIDDMLGADLGDVQLAEPRCTRTLSPLSARWFDHAALHALRRWIVDGVAPPRRLAWRAPNGASSKTTTSAMPKAACACLIWICRCSATACSASATATSPAGRGRSGTALPARPAAP